MSDPEWQISVEGDMPRLGFVTWYHPRPRFVTLKPILVIDSIKLAIRRLHFYLIKLIYYGFLIKVSIYLNYHFQQIIRNKQSYWCHLWSIKTRHLLQYSFLYARLQTGRIMVWWCPSGSPSGSPSVRPTLRPSGLRPPIFRTFLLHVLTYWAEILHMTLFWCTTDQVRLSSLCVNFWRSYASLWT